MHVHHLNCISTCPLGGSLMDHGPESVIQRGHLTNHCLLIETNQELVLIDTGLGTRDVENPQGRLSSFFLSLVSPEFRLEMTALEQIKQMGFDPRDVRHIVLTHLDFDHAGGLDDFPQATVHMMRSERDSAVKQETWLDRQRFRPQQWSTQDQWKVYDAGEGESWFGFNRVQQLDGISSDIVLLPLLGHTLGHAGVAVNTGSKWLLQAGDAYFYHQEMNVLNPHCTPGLNLYQIMMEKDRKARLWNQDRLRELKRTHSEEVEIFCAHDVVEFEKLSGRSAEVPAEKILKWEKPKPFQEGRL
ncbi:MBL fold metallo-hydrolase [Bdellovibrio bacteriovorus]|uniref:MBL fold metallo-hydrolase n=1 Tax=Bdellovibrio bacteriovorus TaxID=959 RepID=A0A150WVK6_BDEBC|nr:MBL fold metallo-hydrolase [Bdellovibrio bacteriovorus]KYG70555.1 MBL fold metallo-hydrolase [Bdellovibrio bacteriovorus]